MLQQSHHVATARQLLWLVLWAAVSLSSLLLNRVLVAYDGFEVPFFLAVLAAAVAAVFSRVFVYLHSINNSSNNSGSKDWMQLVLMGAAMGGSTALNIASLQSLPVPTAVLIQVCV